jgi:hypothetical protein
MIRGCKVPIDPRHYSARAIPQLDSPLQLHPLLSANERRASGTISPWRARAEHCHRHRNAFWSRLRRQLQFCFFLLPRNVYLFIYVFCVFFCYFLRRHDVRMPLTLFDLCSLSPWGGPCVAGSSKDNETDTHIHTCRHTDEHTQEHTRTYTHKHTHTQGLEKREWRGCVCVHVVHARVYV